MTPRVPGLTHAKGVAADTVAVGPKRGRGRAAGSKGLAARRLLTEDTGKVWEAAEVAAAMGLPLERLLWHCRAGALAGRASFFFGAYERDGKWWLPVRMLERALGSLELRAYSVAEVAELLGFGPGKVRGMLRVVPFGVRLEAVRRPGELGARMFGPDGKGDLRIPGAEVDRWLHGEGRAA